MLSQLALPLTFGAGVLSCAAFCFFAAPSVLEGMTFGAGAGLLFAAFRYFLLHRKGKRAP